MENIYDVVMGRKSVRTFDGRDLTPEDREKLTRFAEGVSIDAPDILVDPDVEYIATVEL